MTYSMCNYDLGSNNTQKKKRVYILLCLFGLSVPCGLFMSSLRLEKKIFQSTFFVFLFFPTAHSFTVLSHLRETVNNVYNDINDFMYSRGNK